MRMQAELPASVNRAAERGWIVARATTPWTRRMVVGITAESRSALRPDTFFRPLWRKHRITVALLALGTPAQPGGPSDEIAQYQKPMGGTHAPAFRDPRAARRRREGKAWFPVVIFPEADGSGNRASEEFVAHQGFPAGHVRAADTHAATRLPEHQTPGCQRRADPQNVGAMNRVEPSPAEEQQDEKPEPEGFRAMEAELDHRGHSRCYIE